MSEISNAVVDSLGKGDNCSSAWESGNRMAEEMGHSENLMGMKPESSKFSRTFGWIRIR